MAIQLKMPALSPTMEEGTLAKWLVKKGDKIEPGDVIAEIETDKATMEFEAIDEGIVADLAIDAGTENVKVGTVIATLAEEGEDPSKLTSAPAPAADVAESPKETVAAAPAKSEPAPVAAVAASASVAPVAAGERVIASPLARRIAISRNIDLTAIKGSGPHGRIVKADVAGAKATAMAPAATAGSPPAPKAAPVAAQDFGIPHTAEKLSNMRKTIARRLTESKQQVPHIYLTVDIRLDVLLKLRAELNDSLASSGVKLSVNDLLIKALARSLIAVPKCNVQFAGDQLMSFGRADISVAVSIPAGLITPIVVDAGSKTVSTIATEMKDLAGRAREGKLQPHEFMGGTASLSNMGMYGIKQFEAVINPPQGMIMAIGAGEKRPCVIDDTLQIATVLSATGSFDHRAIDGADGAQLMQAFQNLVEKPLGLLA